ncbi:MAG: hypothetical protein MUP47_03755 [Phycisphaerae bacterium]|nr:hypothetical protein [Phycisphaerae bacterium]
MTAEHPMPPEQAPSATPSATDLDRLVDELAAAYQGLGEAQRVYHAAKDRTKELRAGLGEAQGRLQQAAGHLLEAKKVDMPLFGGPGAAATGGEAPSPETDGTPPMTRPPQAPGDRHGRGRRE